jgi:hypothetical protein
MLYPKVLLPQRGYRLFTVSQLTDKSFIARRSLLSESDYLNSLGQVRVEALLTTEDTEDNSQETHWSEVFGLSNALLGVYLPEHVKILVEHKDVVWRPGCKLPKPSDIKFRVVDLPPIFFCVDDLHNTKFPIKKPLKKNGVESFSGTCMLEHHPSLFNFWHFEFVVYDEAKKEMKNTDKKWRKEAAEFIAHSILKISAVHRTPAFGAIPKKVYCDGWFKRLVCVRREVAPAK